MSTLDSTTDENWVSTTAGQLSDEWDLPENLIQRASIAVSGVETVDGKYIEATESGLANLLDHVRNQFA